MSTSASSTSTHATVRAGKAELRSLAAAQHGVFSAPQADARGVDRHALQRWSRSGEIQRVGGLVWGFSGSSDSDQRTAMIQLLRHGPDGALALGSAAALWGMTGYRLLPAHVLRVRTTKRRQKGGRHTSTRFGERHVAVKDGLRATSPGRTLFDLAGREHPERIANLLDRSIGRGLVTIGVLQGLLVDLQGRGRPGIQTMRTLIDARSDTEYMPTGSNLERRFEWVLEGAGILGFERQVTLGDADGVIGRVDYLWRSARLVVEVQSALHHRTLTDQRRDANRLRRLRAAGWFVLEVAEHDIWYEPDRVVLQVTEALAAAWKTR